MVQISCSFADVATEIEFSGSYNICLHHNLKRFPIKVWPNLLQNCFYRYKHVNVVDFRFKVSSLPSTKKSEGRLDE